MARAQYDREEVVRTSGLLFWRHGLNGASMQQVFEATGLKPGSIYLAFGSKEGLFRESLEQYARDAIASMQKTIDDSDSVEVAICQIITGMVHESSQSDFCSCFLLKSRLELAAEHSELHGFAGEQLARVESMFGDALAPKHGAEKADLLASSIMLHIFGIRVYGYSEGSETKMFTALRQGLPWLPWPSV